MAKCNWKIDPHTDAEILIVDGVERVRISDAKNMRQDEGKPGASNISVDDLRKQLEADFGCN